MRRRLDLPRPYQWFVRLFAVWLDAQERAEVVADMIELRALRADEHGRRGLGRYTWRQLFFYPLRLIASRRRIRQRASPVPSETTVDTLLFDLRAALRAVRRAPLLGITIVAILGLAIAVNSTVYSVVRSVLLQPLPYPGPERVVAVWMTDSQGQRMRMTPGNYADLREVDLFDSLGAFSGSSTTFTPDDGEPELLSGGAVAGEYFDALGVAPLHGRTFSAAERATGGPSVMVLGHDVWVRRFASDPAAVGQLAMLQGIPFEIVGVMPAGVYPSTASIGATIPLIPGGPDYWVPLRYSDALYENRRPHIIGVVGRLRAEISFEAAAAAIAALGATLGERDPMNEGEGLELASFRDEVVGSSERPLWILLLTAGVVLLIAATNVASLLLVRAEARQGELAVRAALGADRWRLVRLQLAETLLFAAVGGALGVGLTPRLLDAVRSTVPTQIPRIQDAAVDGNVVLFCLLAVAAATVVSGFVPALFATRPGLLGALRQTAAAVGVGKMRRQLQSSMVVAQAALAVVLLVVAGLLVSSFVRLETVDLGFEEQGALIVRMNAPSRVTGDTPTLLAFWSDVQERVAQIPGVSAVGLGDDGPVARNWVDGFRIEGMDDQSEDSFMSAALRRVTPGYLPALRVPLVAGRALADTDSAEAAPVAMINEALAQRYFGDTDPLGRQITIPSLQRMFGDSVASTREVVGVVGNVRFLGPAESAEPSIYMPIDQFPSPRVVAIVRQDGTRPDVSTALRLALQEVDSTLPVRGIERLDGLTATFTAGARFSTVLIGAFGMLGLVLSGLGLYALVSRIVALRAREYGIRRAVGATGGTLVLGVVRTAVGPALLGGALGVVLALPVALALRAQLFDTTPMDPLSYAVAPTVLVAVAVAAAGLCARRALRVDPVEALRTQ